MLLLPADEDRRLTQTRTLTDPELLPTSGRLFKAVVSWERPERQLAGNAENKAPWLLLVLMAAKTQQFAAIARRTGLCSTPQFR